MSNDTPETPDLQEIDVHNNRESRAYAAESTQRVSRASDGGAPPHEATPAGELPERGDQGTAGATRWPGWRSATPRPRTPRSRTTARRRSTAPQPGTPEPSVIG